MLFGELSRTALFETMSLYRIVTFASRPENSVDGRTLLNLRDWALHGSALRNTSRVIVVSRSDVDPLIGHFREGELQVRRRKNPNKGLAASLIGSGRFQWIDVPYRSESSLRRGVKSLLAATERCGDFNTHFLVCDEAVFESLWNSTVTRSRSTDVPLSRATRRMRMELDLLATEIVPVELVQSYVGEAPSVDLVRRQICRMAPAVKHPILILGETGTGKEIVARWIHRVSGLKGQFIAVNCGSIPSALIESELFGSMKGAFTGATNRAGLWENAHGGSLYLDELGDLSPQHQVSLLRAVETGFIRRVGGRSEQHFQVRLIAATSRPLLEMVSRGTFRSDLYFRLETFTLETPSLRAHPEDIPGLARYFWSKDLGSSQVLCEAVLYELQRDPWWGNVRSLKSFLTRLATLSAGRPITAEMVRTLIGRDPVSPARQSIHPDPVPGPRW